MDYREWTARAKQFIDQFRRCHPGMKAELDIGPPATAEQVAQVETTIARPLPAQFREFLLTASADCDFRYWWVAEGEAQTQAVISEFGTGDIPGGLEFFARLTCLADDYEFHRELVEEDAYGDSPFCKDPLPIGGMGNGDHIAIDLNSHAVIFLAHDVASYVLARDFDSFLAAWESICYLDFDLSPYEQFVNRDGGGIDPTDRPELRRLRELLLTGG